VSLSGVLAGIKHRKGSRRKGLGGGTSVAVSFTQSRRLACEIARCLVEAIKVANDMLGWDDLVAMAERDGVLDLAVSRWRGTSRTTYESETNAEVLETARRGLIATEISGLGVPISKLPPGLLVHPHASRWMGRDEEYTSGHALRAATPEEDREQRFRFYMGYLSAAGSANKRIDPLFFSVYAEDMRGLDPADVGVIEAYYDGGVLYPKANTLDWKIEDGRMEVPPGMFTYLPSMDEYRIYDLSRLRITGTIECSAPVSANPRRRNSDERFRELERRVLASPGDGAAWVALVREALRSGRGFDQAWVSPFTSSCRNAAAWEAMIVPFAATSRDPAAWEAMIRSRPMGRNTSPEWEQPIEEMLGPLNEAGDLTNAGRYYLLAQVYYNLRAARRLRENAVAGPVVELAIESEHDRTSQLFGGFFTRPSYADPLEGVAAIDADRLTQLDRVRPSQVQGREATPPQRGDIWIPHWLVSGDYWQGDSHSRANKAVFLERWSDTPGVFPVTGSYSLEGVAIILGNEYPDGMIADLRESMGHSDLSEGRRLDLEHEEQAQAWGLYKHDWPRVLADAFPKLAQQIEKLDEEALRSLFDSGVEVIERSRDAWDSGPQGATIDLDDVAEELDEEDVRVAIKKRRRGKRQNPWSISKTFTFEAAHYLPGVPEGHKCRRLHGHSYAVTVELRNDELDQAGMVLDYGEVSQIDALPVLPDRPDAPAFLDRLSSGLGDRPLRGPDPVLARLVVALVHDRRHALEDSVVLLALEVGDDDRVAILQARERAEFRAGAMPAIGLSCLLAFKLARAAPPLVGVLDGRDRAVLMFDRSALHDLRDFEVTLAVTARHELERVTPSGLVDVALALGEAEEPDEHALGVGDADAPLAHRPLGFRLLGSHSDLDPIVGRLQRRAGDTKPLRGPLCSETRSLSAGKRMIARPTDTARMP
jgi:hypothetical protein